MKDLKVIKIILESVNERGVSRSFADSGFPFAPFAPFALNIPGFHGSPVFHFQLGPFSFPHSRETPVLHSVFTSPWRVVPRLRDRNRLPIPVMTEHNPPSKTAILDSHSAEASSK